MWISSDLILLISVRLSRDPVGITSGCSKMRNRPPRPAQTIGPQSILKWWYSTDWSVIRTFWNSIPNASNAQRSSLQHVHNNLWKAMALYQLGQKQDAKQLLNETRKQMNAELPTPEDWLPHIHWQAFTYHLIRQEAEELIFGPEGDKPQPKPLNPVEEFQQAVNHPDGPASKIALAKVHALCGFYDDARTSANKAIEQLEELEKKFPQQAARLRSDRGKALAILAEVHLKREEYTEAVAVYRQALEFYPSSSLRLELGQALTALGNDQEAAAEYDRVFQFYSRSANGLNNLAWQIVLQPNPKLRNGRAAVKMAEKAVELSPKTGIYWNTLGAAHYRAGNWQEGITALEKSMSLQNGGNSFDWFFLAMANHQQEQLPEAQKWLDQAVKWMEENKPGDRELTFIRQEAEALMASNTKRGLRTGGPCAISQINQRGISPDGLNVPYRMDST